ncbi:MAG: SocA family protein [Candidatus Portnoybacteria bacterium]|nr:SocA family protein [Candidatus Portnoybacteria bacterium]
MVVSSKKSLKVQDVGRYFLYLAGQEKEPITNKKLQKLVYYAQAWSLVLNNQRLFSEPIEAWVHGPAVRSLYAQYKKFGFEPIQEEVKSDSIKISEKTKEFLNTVWKAYGKLDAGYLEMLTHSEKPWREARRGLQNHESSGNEISLESMKNYYSEKLKHSQNKQK